MTFADYLLLVVMTKRREPNWRMGQTYFNVLTQRPDLSERVRGSTKDPFYRDELIPEFLAWIAEHWDDNTV